MTFKSGFVAILGRPNVGKSTFLNHVMGQKIAIMSDKAQTTRNKIMGIYTTDKEQIVFIDTPGIHKPKTALGDFMVESAYSTLREVDTVLFMVPADEPRGKGDDMIIERLKQAKVPVILVVTRSIPTSSLSRLTISVPKWISRRLFQSQPFKETMSLTLWMF